MSIIKCPFCAEEINEGDSVCRHCQSKLNIKKEAGKFNKKISVGQGLMVLTGILVILIVTGGIMASIRNEKYNEKYNKQVTDINLRIKTTNNYIANKTPIEEMFVYTNQGIYAFVNPTGSDNTYSESDLVRGNYYADKGDQAKVYEESADKNKMLVKIVKDDRELIGWIDSKLLVTKDEYNDLKLKEQREDINNAIIPLDAELEIKQGNYKDLDLLPSEYERLNDMYISNGNYNLDKEAFFRQILQREINKLKGDISSYKNKLNALK